jgi:hypothetical protein
MALTASAFSDERNRAIEAGCAGLIRKPFREAEIFDALERHLGAAFVYEDDDPQAHRALAPLAELADLTAHLATPKLEDLHRAVIECDIGAIDAAIAAIGQDDATLATRLRDYAADFRYAELRGLVASTMAAKEGAA